MRPGGTAGRHSVWALALGGLLGCAPPASSVPLGLGPLAIAEREARAREAANARSADEPAASPARPPAAAGDAGASVEGPEIAAGAAAEADAKPEAAAASDAPQFEGLFAGEDVAVFRFTGFPEREQHDDKAKIRIERVSARSVSITLINSEDGSDLCQLAARVEGNVALIEPGQSCFGDGSEGSPEAEMTEGRAVLDGDRLDMEAAGTLSVALPDQELDGELTYSFTGQRQ